MSKMLEEMAGRIKREIGLKHEVEGPYFVGAVLCSACPGTCNSHVTCPRTEEDEGALLMAHWAVRQVAEALTYEADGVTPKIWTDDKSQVALMNLIAEARKEDEAECTI